MDGWYYTKRGTRYGPVDDEVLAQFVTSGVIGAADQVWRKGMDEALTYLRAAARNRDAAAQLQLLKLGESW